MLRQEHCGSPGLHFSSRIDLGGPGCVGFEMEFWGGRGWDTTAHSECERSQGDPLTPHPSSSQFWHLASAARPALPCAHTRGVGKSEAPGRPPWLVAARTGPQRPGPAGARAHPEPARKAHKAKPRAPRPGRESTERGGAGRARRAGGVGCHPPRTPRPGGGEANH